jgi:hypothetical protein
MKIHKPTGVGLVSGFGVPTAGTSGQILAKVNSTNYNTQWVDNGVQAEYLSVGKTSSQTFILGFNTITNFSTPTVNTLSVSTWNSTTGLFTAGRPATYRVSGSFLGNQSTDIVGDYYSLILQKNGLNVAEQLHIVYSALSTFKSNILPPILVSCNTGDVLRFNWYQSMNANRANTILSTQNYIVIEELPTRIIR